MQASRTGCLICGSEDTALAHIGRDRLHHIEGSFHIMKCHKCGTFFRLPSLTYADVEKYYPTECYTSYVHNRSGLHGVVEKLKWRKKRRYVEKFLSTGRLLDIGCATGGFLAEMGRHGWNVEGVEPHKRVAEIGQNRGWRVTVSTLEDAGLPGGSFDVVTMWHVFEHIEEPRKALVEVRRVLKQDGLLILCIPNLHSLEAKVFAHLWMGFDPPRHAYAFSRKGLNVLFDQAGFDLVESRTFFGGVNSFILSMGFFLDEKCHHPVLRSSIKRITESVCCGCLLSVPLFFVDRFRRGSVIVHTLAKRRVQGNEF